MKSNFDQYNYCMLVCLFGVFHPNWEIFIHMETSPLSVKGSKFFTYARYSWPLSSEGYLACHCFWHTDYPFIIYHRAFGSRAVTTYFNDLGLSRMGFDLTLAGWNLLPTAPPQRLKYFVVNVVFLMWKLRINELLEQVLYCWLLI